VRNNEGDIAISSKGSRVLFHWYGEKSLIIFPFYPFPFGNKKRKMAKDIKHLEQEWYAWYLPR